MELQKGVDFKEYIYVLQKWKGVIIGSLVLVTLISFLADLKKTPLYKSEVVLLIESTPKRDTYLEDVSGISYYEDKSQDLKTQVQIIKTDEELLQKAAEKLNNYSIKLRTKFTPSKVSKLINAEVDERVSLRDSRTGIIRLSALSDKPIVAKYVARIVADTFVEYKKQNNEKKLIEAKKFIEKQLAIAEKNLENSEDILAKYQEGEEVNIQNEGNGRPYFSEMQLETEKSKVKAELISAKARREKIKTDLQKLFPSSIKIEDELKSDDLNKQLTSLEVQLMNAKTLYTSNNPEVKRLETQISLLKEEIKEKMQKDHKGEYLMSDSKYEKLINDLQDVEMTIISLQAKYDALKSDLGLYNKVLKKLPEKRIILGRLQRNVEVNKNVYMVLREKLEEIKIAASMNLGEVKILKNAKLPLKPVNKNQFLTFFLSIILGLVVGITIAFILEYTSDTVEGEHDIEETLKVPVVGTIPLMKNGFKENSLLIDSKEVPKSITESFTSLAINFKFSLKNELKGSYFISSFFPQEGKSIISANIAGLLSQNKKVLLVDADFRNPTLHKFFNFQNDVGFSDIILNGSNLAKPIKEVNKSGWDFLPAGKCYVSGYKLMSSKNLKSTIDKFESEYDLVIFDTPPFLLAPDVFLLASYLKGGFLVVVPIGVKRKMLKSGIKNFMKANINIFGVILNKVPITEYGRYYYGYGINYYYKEYYSKYYESNKYIS